MVSILACAYFLSLLQLLKITCANEVEHRSLERALLMFSLLICKFTEAFLINQTRFSVMFGLKKTKERKRKVK